MQIILRRIPLNGDIRDTIVQCAPNSAFSVLKQAKAHRQQLIDYGRIYINGKQVTIRESHAIPVEANMVITMVEDLKTIGELIVL